MSGRVRTMPRGLFIEGTCLRPLCIRESHFPMERVPDNVTPDKDDIWSDGVPFRCRDLKVWHVFPRTKRVTSSQGIKSELSITYGKYGHRIVPEGFGGVSTNIAFMFAYVTLKHPSWHTHTRLRQQPCIPSPCQDRLDVYWIPRTCTQMQTPSIEHNTDTSYDYNRQTLVSFNHIRNICIPGYGPCISFHPR